MAVPRPEFTRLKIGRKGYAADAVDTFVDRVLEHVNAPSHDGGGLSSHELAIEVFDEARGSSPYDEDQVDAWRRERPDLDVAPLHVFSRVSRLARRLDLDRTRAFASHQLEGWEFDVLSALRRAGAPYELSPGQLIRQTLVTSGTMTNRVDRLAHRGLVQRLPDPADRRGVLVQLTDAGQSSVDAAFEALIRHEGRLLAGLPDGDRARLAGALRALMEPFSR